MNEEDEIQKFLAEVEKDAHAMAEALMVPRQPGGPRGHHFLPKFLLKRFADEEGRIATIDLTRAAEIRINHVSDTAKIKDYHTIDQPGIGPSNAIESIRSRVESLAAPAVERVADGFLPASNPDRFAIAMWAAQMYCFAPPVRRHMEVIADQVAKIELEGRVGAVPSSEYEVVLPQNNQLQLGMEVAQHATGILRQMRLAVVKYSAPGVAIGDCPLWMLSSADMPANTGIGSPPRKRSDCRLIARRNSFSTVTTSLVRRRCGTLTNNLRLSAASWQNRPAAICIATPRTPTFTRTSPARPRTGRSFMGQIATRLVTA